MARLISFDDGEVVLDETIDRSNSAVCRFPSAKEQARGITEVSLTVRRADYKRAQKKINKETSGNKSRS